MAPLQPLLPEWGEKSRQSGPNLCIHGAGQAESRRPWDDEDGKPRPFRRDPPWYSCTALGPRPRERRVAAALLILREWMHHLDAGSVALVDG